MRIVPVRRLCRVLFVALAALWLGACQELVGGDDRREPAGLVVVDSRGNEVASYSAGSVRGEITVSTGATETFRVHLTDRSGGRISIDGVRYVLHAQALITSVATASALGAGEVQVTGRTAGRTTSLALSVLDNGAAIFPVVNVQVRVRAG
jgi:hypothetical protein